MASTQLLSGATKEDEKIVREFLQEHFSEENDGLENEPIAIWRADTTNLMMSRLCPTVCLCPLVCPLMLVFSPCILSGAAKQYKDVKDGVYVVDTNRVYFIINVSTGGQCSKSDQKGTFQELSSMAKIEAVDGKKASRCFPRKSVSMIAGPPYWYLHMFVNDPEKAAELLREAARGSGGLGAPQQAWMADYIEQHKNESSAA